MNFLKGFPEIEKFFNRKFITHIEIEKFRDEISNRYENKVMRQTALTLIKLQVLKLGNKKSPQNIKPSIKPSKKKIIDSLTIENIFPEVIIDFKANNILSIAQSLQVNSELIIEILSQKNIEKTETQFLTPNEFKELEDFFQSKLKALKRKEKQEKKILSFRKKKIKKSLNKTDSVYDKIMNQKVIGKFIYIRKK